MSGKDGISKLINFKERRLQKLKEIKALFGINTRPEYLIEIEDLEADLRGQKMAETLGDHSMPGKHQEDYAAADLVPRKEVFDQPTEPGGTVEIRPGSFSLIIEGGEIKGAEEDMYRLKVFGGPGKLIVYSGQVVVLHRRGRLTRAIGLGSVKLRKEEKIKAILPLSPQGNIQIIENVRTRDRVPLQILVLHAVQLEPAEDTKNRLRKNIVDAEANLQLIRENKGATPNEIQVAEQNFINANQELQNLEHDKIIGDDYNQCYESVAKLAAIRAPTDVWGAVRFPIANSVKDAVMTEYAEELFSIDGDSVDLETRINQRKIKEIEELVLERATQSGLAKGIKPLVVDINEISFPAEIENAIEDEVRSRILERIQQTEVRTAAIKAKVTVIEAKAEAKAKAIMLRELLRAVREENISLSSDELTNALFREL